MRFINRYLKSAIKEDLKDKMVFINGPRQAGKTTLALSFLKEINPSVFQPSFDKNILTASFFFIKFYRS